MGAHGLATLALELPGLPRFDEDEAPLYLHRLTRLDSLVSGTQQLWLLRQLA